MVECVCRVCDSGFIREIPKGRFVQVLKLCDKCSQWHKWCAFGSHTPLRSAFYLNPRSKSGLQHSCKKCIVKVNGRRLYTCGNCESEFLPPEKSQHLNGRSTPLCNDCYITVKHCKQCDIFKPHSEFGTARDKSCGMAGQCKECTRAKWHVLPAERRALPKLSRFKLTYVEYSAMREKCADLCEICRSPETAISGGKVRTLAIDHCHTSGQVRGLLCQSCNNALGLMRDDPKRLRAAGDYLERFA